MRRTILYLIVAIMTGMFLANSFADDNSEGTYIPYTPPVPTANDSLFLEQQINQQDYYSDLQRWQQDSTSPMESPANNPIWQDPGPNTAPLQPMNTGPLTGQRQTITPESTVPTGKAMRKDNKFFFMDPGDPEVTPQSKYKNQ